MSDTDRPAGADTEDTDMTTELTTTRNRYDDGDTVRVTFVDRFGPREGWIARADREGTWFWGVSATAITNDPPEVKAARRAERDALPGPFAAGDTVVVNGTALIVPEEVKRYGYGDMIVAA